MSATLAWAWLTSAVHAVRCGSLTMLRGSRPAAITRLTQGASVRARVIEPSYRRRYLTIVNKEWRLAGTFPRRRYEVSMTRARTDAPCVRRVIAAGRLP